MATDFNELKSHAPPVAPGSERSFGLVGTGVFAIVGLYPLLSGGPPRVWALGIAGAFLAAAFLWPAVLARPNRLWFRFGLLLHLVMSPVILGVLYFGVLSPMGLLMRLCGRDELRLRADRSAASHWQDRQDGTFSPDSLKNQF